MVPVPVRVRVLDLDTVRTGRPFTSESGSSRELLLENDDRMRCLRLNMNRSDDREDEECHSF